MLMLTISFYLWQKEKGKQLEQSSPKTLLLSYENATIPWLKSKKSYKLITTSF